MEPTLILFDVDGTLIDTAGAGRTAVQAAFVEVVGCSHERIAHVRVPYAGRTDPSIFRAVSEALGVAGDRYEAIRERLFDTYLRELRATMAVPNPRRRVLPGVVALLDSLAGQPEVRLGLLTGNLEAGARTKLEPFGLNRYFEGGGFSSDAEDRREIARVAARRLAIRDRTAIAPDRTWVVGDTPLDVDCARANGFRALAVGTGGATPEEMASWRCDSWFPDLAETEAVLGVLGLDDGMRGSDRRAAGDDLGRPGPPPDPDAIRS